MKEEVNDSQKERVESETRGGERVSASLSDSHDCVNQASGVSKNNDHG